MRIKIAVLLLIIVLAFSGCSRYRKDDTQMYNMLNDNIGVHIDSTTPQLCVGHKEYVYCADIIKDYRLNGIWKTDVGDVVAFVEIDGMQTMGFPNGNIGVLLIYGPEQYLVYINDGLTLIDLEFVDSQHMILTVGENTFNLTKLITDSSA